MLANNRKKLNWFYVPALVMIAAFIAYPLAHAVQLSLFKWNGYSSSMKFIGWTNYETMLFSDPNFWISFRNNVIYGFGCTFIQNVFGLAFAMFLNEKFFGRNCIRTVIYLPVMISPLVMGYIMYFIFQLNGGALNDIWAQLGLEAVDWLGDGNRAVGIIVLENTWQYVGLSMVIYLAGLQNIPKTYIEVAEVDGVGAWGKFRFIQLPLLLPAVSSAVLINLIGGLKLYDIIVALTKGGPAKRSNSLATYIDNRYFDAERAGYAAAVGVFSFVFIMLVSMALNRYFRRREVEIK